MSKAWWIMQDLVYDSEFGSLHHPASTTTRTSICASSVPPLSGCNLGKTSGKASAVPTNPSLIKMGGKTMIR